MDDLHLDRLYGTSSCSGWRGSQMAFEYRCDYIRLGNVLFRNYDHVRRRHSLCDRHVSYCTSRARGLDHFCPDIWWFQRRILPVALGRGRWRRRQFRHTSGDRSCCRCASGDPASLWASTESETRGHLGTSSENIHGAEQSRPLC